MLEWFSPEARDNIVSWSGVRTPCVGEFVQVPAISGFDPKTGSYQGLRTRGAHLAYDGPSPHLPTEAVVLLHAPLLGPSDAAVRGK